MNPLTRLPCATYPRPDELLSSWLTRLAHSHLIKTYTFGRMLFPGVNVWNTDLDRRAPEDILQTLAIRTGTPLEQVQQTVLRRYEGRLYLRHNGNSAANWILPLGIYHRTRRHYGLLFCPCCLRKDGAVPYFRTHWRLAIAQVCTSCGVYLHERCPACERPVTFFRVELGRRSAVPDTPISHCFHCGLDLATVRVKAAPTHILTAQAELERILLDGWNAQVFFPHQYFNVLHQLVKTLVSTRPASKILQRAVDTQTGWSPLEENKSVRTYRTPVELLPLRVRAGVIRQAQWLLTDWPHRLLETVRQYKIASTPFLYAMPEIPFWYHSVIMEKLYVSNGNRYFSGFWRK